MKKERQRFIRNFFRIELNPKVCFTLIFVLQRQQYFEQSLKPYMLHKFLRKIAWVYLRNFLLHKFRNLL